MVDAAPFAALRYDPAVAGDPATTSAPAYDDLERFTYARHRTASPYTVLELLTGEEDSYRAAATTFDRWLRTKVVVKDPDPAYYLYEIHELRRGVPSLLRGVLAAVAVRGDTLLPHEGVEPARAQARMRRLEAVPADLAPVFAVHSPAPPSLREVLDAAPSSRPVVAITDEAGTDHRVWALRDPEVVAAITTGLEQVQAVIADGHHRFAAAALRAQQERPAERTLTYLVDGDAYGPQLDAVHRLVSGSPVAMLQRLRDRFAIVPTEAADLQAALLDAGPVAFGLRLTGGDAAVAVARDPDAVRAQLPPGRSPAWARLDAALWEYGVRPVLGDGEVAYRVDVAAAARELDDHPGMLFVLRAAQLSEVFDCALAGESMPPKSTWFRPKPRAGLVMRSLD